MLHLLPRGWSTRSPVVSRSLEVSTNRSCRHGRMRDATLPLADTRRIVPHRAEQQHAALLHHANWQTSARGQLIAIGRRFLQITTRSSFDMGSVFLSLSDSLGTCAATVQRSTITWSVNIKHSGQPFETRPLSLSLSLFLLCFLAN